MVYVRPTGSTAVSGEIDIHKASIYKNGVETSPLGVIECRVSPRPGDIPTKLTIDSFDNVTAQFSKLEKSGVFHIYVGSDMELKYGTNDEYAGITDGKQSTKFYITPSFTVYDRITAESVKAGKAELTKTDEGTGAPLKDAVYSLYKKDGTLVSENLATDDKGKLTTTDLMPGDYYFKETKAPDGYKLNTDKITFAIAENTTGTIPATTVGGGVETVTDSDGNTVTASKNERLFAGGKAGVGETGNPLSPDITLSSAEDVLSVVVTYTKLDVVGADVIRTFKTLAEAQADINTEKNNNTILGSVSVKAYYASDSADAPVAATTTDAQLSKTDITVDKVWVDNEDFSGTHPDITIHLLSGTAKAATAVIKAPATSYTFKDLPAEDGSGNPITYTVTEDSVAGYTSSVSGTTVTNTFENTEKTSLSGKKQWADYNNALKTRPDQVTVALLADGTEIRTLEVKAADNWAFTFNDLPKYTDAGKKIAYTVNEKGTVTDYTASVLGTEITNTLDEKANNIVTVEGQKSWADYNDAFKTRPETLKIDLYQNDTLYQTEELSAKDDWTYRFTGLPKYDANGKEYVYTVKEAAVPEGYTSSVKGYDITNTLDETYKKNTPQIEDTTTSEVAYKKNTPQTGDTTTQGGLVLLALSAIGVIAIAGKKRRKI